MKKLITLVLFSLTTIAFSQISDKPEDISPLLIGEQIPNVNLKNVDGKAIETNTIFNKKTVVVIYRGGW